MSNKVIRYQVTIKWNQWHGEGTLNTVTLLRGNMSTTGTSSNDSVHGCNFTIDSDIEFETSKVLGNIRILYALKI